MRSNKLIVSAATLPVFLISLVIAPLAHAESTGQYIDDAAISTKVRAAIMADSVLKGSNISVETDQSAVQLTGLVNTKNQEEQAVRDAKQISGVKDVQDHLTIRETQDQ